MVRGESNGILKSVESIVNFTKSLENTLICDIDSEEDASENVVRLPCGHQYKAGFWERWKEADPTQANRCPNCRKEVTDVGIIIFPISDITGFLREIRRECDTLRQWVERTQNGLIPIQLSKNGTADGPFPTATMSGEGSPQTTTPPLPGNLSDSIVITNRHSNPILFTNTIDTQDDRGVYLATTDRPRIVADSRDLALNRRSDLGRRFQLPSAPPTLHSLPTTVVREKNVIAGVSTASTETNVKSVSTNYPTNTTEVKMAPRRTIPGR